MVGASKIAVVVMVVMACSMASQGTPEAIGDTGWTVDYYEIGVGRVTVTYKGMLNGAVWIELDKEFNSPSFDAGLVGDDIPLEFTLVNPEAADFAPDIIITGEIIMNRTGRTWYDFHMTVEPALGEGQVWFDPAYCFEGPIVVWEADVEVVYNPFSEVSLGEGERPVKLDFEGGQLESGQNFFPGYRGTDDNYVRIVTELGAGQSFIMKEWPTIPEPATFVLLGAGAMVLLGLERRRRAYC